MATTVLISFKGERDIIRKPPNFLPVRHADQAFDPTACRWAVEGYQRVLAPKPTPGGLLPFALTGNMVRIYIPNSLLYATTTALLVVLLAGMAGYAFSRYRFRGRTRPDGGHSRHHRRAPAHQPAGPLSDGGDDAQGAGSPSTTTVSFSLRSIWAFFCRSASGSPRVSSTPFPATWTRPP